MADLLQPVSTNKFVGLLSVANSTEVLDFHIQTSLYIEYMPKFILLSEKN
ncbi:hypothetical protein NIES25_10160 [Nostoc linckia NIES-25]|nr:hypothetical protein NIES25_10160 [Nostoc linckia NIES-25]